jgi:hypothetical protein
VEVSVVVKSIVVVVSNPLEADISFKFAFNCAASTGGGRKLGLSKELAATGGSEGGTLAVSNDWLVQSGYVVGTPAVSKGWSVQSVDVGGVLDPLNGSSAHVGPELSVSAVAVDASPPNAFGGILEESDVPQRV